MIEVKSCGVFVMRSNPEQSFLLMKHASRWDLPKGHVDAGESDLECALRELREETGIGPEDIDLDDQFQFLSQYQVLEPRVAGGVAHKTLRIYLGWLKREVAIQPSEHLGFEWFKWQPPHHIQSMTIDPLLSAVETHLATKQ